MSNNAASAAAVKGHHPPNIKLYVSIYGVLMFLTILTVIVSYWHLPPAGAISVALLIAACKAGLVLAFFMHLKGEHKLIFYFLGIALITCIGFFIIAFEQPLLADRLIHLDVEAQRVSAEQPEGSTQDIPQGDHTAPQPATAPAP